MCFHPRVQCALSGQDLRYNLSVGVSRLSGVFLSMIKSLLQRVFKPIQRQVRSMRSSADTSSEPVLIRFESHGISRDSVSIAALKTTEGLQKAGFEAFVVGGAVRDLLLKRVPKDFDVATNATPEQVHRLFRRSRIIGRRFRLVHVMFGDETVEVSTFRGHHLSEDAHAQVADSGRILRDNVFGSQAEDAIRRDFTANALYYNPATQEILDYQNGVSDLRSGQLKMIGDPATRYREDPVRMLRAIRLSAKLGLEIAPTTRQPIPDLADLLHEVPASRLFDEMLKLFMSGHAVQSARSLREHGLHRGLLPLLDVVLEQPLGEKFVHLALKNTDERVLADKPVSPGFLFATLLWHEVLPAWENYQRLGERAIPALHLAMNEVCDNQAQNLAIHKRYSSTMKEIWGLQPRFEQRSGKRPFSLFEHPRFRAGYDFLLLRAASGEIAQELVDWWTRFIDGDSTSRNAMLMPASTEPKKRRRRRRKPTTTSNEQNPDENSHAIHGDDD